MVFLVLHATAITDQLPLLLAQGGVKDGWLDLSHAGSQTNSDEDDELHVADKFYPQTILLMAKSPMHDFCQ